MNTNNIGNDKTGSKDLNIINANALANNANEFIPTPKESAEAIDAIIKQSGEIIGYHLESGRSVSKEEGVEMAKQGLIRGVAVAENKGTEYLRSIADGEEGNNLSNLPVI